MHFKGLNALNFFIVIKKEKKKYNKKEVKNVADNLIRIAILDLAQTSSYSGINTNLLDNWYFGDPINQRGIDETYEWPMSQIGLDRWRSGSSNPTYWKNGSIVFPESGKSYLLQQGLPYPKETFQGMTMTISMVDTNKNLYTTTSIVPTDDTNGNLFGTEVRLSYNNSTGFYYFHILKTNAVAVKLEFGDHQTLAHKIGNNWELNEIPNKQLELIKCQRFYRVQNKVPCRGTENSYVWTNLTFPKMFRTPSVSCGLPTDSSSQPISDAVYDKIYAEDSGVYYVHYNPTLSKPVNFISKMEISAEI